MWPDNTPGQATHTANKWKNHAVANGGRRSKVIAQTYRWDADACEQGQFVASKDALTSSSLELTSGKEQYAKEMPGRIAGPYVQQLGQPFLMHCISICQK